MKSGDVEIVETIPLKRQKSTAILGFAGSGFIGSTAIMHVIRDKGFKQRAYVRSNLIPPMMLILDGEPSYALRIYSNRDDLIFIVSEALIPVDNCWRLGERLMEWLLDKGVEAFVSIEGLPFGTPSGEKVVLGFSTHRRDLANFGVQPTQDSVISGMNACFLESSMRRGVSYTSLFVNTNFVSGVDYGGAAAIIEKLNRMFKLGVDVQDLERRDEMLRQMSQRRTRAESRGFLSSLRRKGR